ncbi:hypothetical protein V6N11_054866 [Hibiscus sabdariffa]|uniref:Uncharacterized protein n=1 Tax=Hibiscus sabdariffa TaxID=183260 RepID=A0ABR2P3B1_9ROSI
MVHSSTNISSTFPLPVHNEQLQPITTPTQEQPLAANGATNNSHDEHTEIAVIGSSKSVPNTVANGDDEHTEFIAIGSSPTMPLTAISNGRDEHIEFTSIESHRHNLLNEVQPEHLELPCDNLAPVYAEVDANDTSSLTDHDMLLSDHVTTSGYGLGYINPLWWRVPIQVN